MEEELNEFVERMEEFSAKNCPSFLSPNSKSVGIMPGHNLDLLQISFDYRLNRTDLLLSSTPDVFKDPEKPDLSVIRGEGL